MRSFHRLPLFVCSFSTASVLLGLVLLLYSLIYLLIMTGRRKICLLPASLSALLLALFPSPGCLNEFQQGNIKKGIA